LRSHRKTPGTCECTRTPIEPQANSGEDGYREALTSLVLEFQPCRIRDALAEISNYFVIFREPIRTCRNVSQHFRIA
jgi:hypothetical protein